VPPLVGPTFVRLAKPIGEPTDGARAAYMLIAGTQLSASGRRLGRCTAGWNDGPGILVADPAATGARVLAALVHELGAAIRLLADPHIAASYLSLVEPRVRAARADAQP